MKKHITTLLVLWGITIAGIVPGTAYAEFNLDKLKAIAEKAKAYQDKMKQGSQQPSSDESTRQPSTNRSLNLDVNDTSVALFNDEAQKLAAKYDVAGIKTGMSIAEARAVVKSKTHLKEYREDGASLVFRTVDNDQKILSKYTQGIHAQTDLIKNRTSDIESLLITFSPEPGQERVVTAIRSLSFKKENMPSAELYRKALIEKYGQPARKALSRDSFVWFFDHQGNPVQLTNTKTMFKGSGQGCLVQSDINTIALQATTPRTRLPDSVSEYSRCGSLMITARLGSGGGPLLHAVDITLVNFSLATESSLSAGRKLEEAEKAYNAARIKDAEQLKPKL